MINFTNLISKVSKVLKVSQQNCESRMGTCLALAKHSPSTYFPVDSVSLSVGLCSPHAFPVQRQKSIVFSISRQSDLAKYVATLAVLLCLSIGQMWGAETYLTSAVNGGYSNKTTNGSGSLLRNNTVYFVSPSSLGLTADYGIDPNKLGVLFYAESDCSVALNYKNTNSNRTITVKVYECDAALLPFLQNAGSTKISSYIFNTYKGAGVTEGGNADLAYWYARQLIKVSSSKYQADDTNAPKVIANSDSYLNTTLYTSLGTFSDHSAIKNETTTNDVKLSASASPYTFTGGKMYAICLQRNSGCALYSLTFTAAGCSGYSFHYGPHTGDWETPICFEQVGSTHEWKIENFTIPSHASGEFWVGHHGETNSQSVTRAWTYGYSDGNGAMKLLPTSNSIVGQATGAKGTISIWDDSGWQNQNVGFTPNGYGITYGGVGHAFNTTATENMWETDVVTLPDVSTTYTMGLATATAGTYVACAHSNAAEAISNMGVTILEGGKKKILLAPGSFNTAGAVYAVWDGTNSAWGDGTTKLFTDADGDGVWECPVASSCTSINLVRMSSGTTTSNIDWSRKWNQTANISVGDLLNKYTITSLSGDNCAYTTTAMHPATGQKGKFRMWANSGDNNWFVHWIPYYVLTYNANGGSGAPSAQSVSSEASSCQLTVSSTEPTRTDYIFEGWSTSSSAVSPDGAWDPGDTHAMTGDVTLYAVWTHCSGPNVTAALGASGVVDGAHNVGDALGTLTCTASARNDGALTYLWKQYEDGQNPETQSVAAAGTNNTATYSIPNNATCTNRHYFCVVTEAGCSVANHTNYSGALTLTEPTYSITYNCDGADSGCPSNVAAATNLPNPLPDAPVKAGYIFDGWYTNAGKTDAAVAGATLTGNVTLYAKWLEDDGCDEETITYVLGVKNATSGSVTPSTHLTNLVNETNVGIGEVTDRSKTDRSGKYATSATDGYGVQFSFDIADGYTFQPTSISMQVSTVSTTDFTFQVTLEDEEGTTLTSNALNSFSDDGVLTNITFPSYTTVFAPGTVTMLVTATREGGNGTYRIGKTITITGDVCEIPTYTVTYKANGGTGSDVVDDAATTISDVPGTFTAPGAMHFMNWNTIAGGAGDTYEPGDAVTSDLTLYAQWGWQLTYDANAGGDAVSNMPDAEIHKPGIYTLSTKVPTRAGYTFDCWNRNAGGTGDCFSAGASFTTGALNETLYAKWNAQLYTIAIGAVTTNQHSGSTVGGTISASAASATAGTTITLTPSPTSGYAFVSWTVSKEGGGTVEVVSNQFTMPAANVTITAVFAETYTISYYENDGTTSIGGLAPTSYSYGVGAVLPTPTKSGYTFEAWYNAWCVNESNEAPCSSGCGWVAGCRTSSIGTDDYGDATYLARWYQTVTLNKNGGDANGSVVAWYNESGTTSLSAPTRAGYVVEGYYAEAGCTNKVMTNTGELVNYSGYVSGGKWIHSDATTLYAKWEERAAEDKYYYGQVKIESSALKVDIPSGSVQFFIDNNGSIENSTAISVSSTPSTGSVYYYSNNLTDAELSKSSNWSSSSSSGRYIRGLKWANGTTYTLALGDKTATSIKFYGWCGGSSKVLTIGGQTFTSNSTKNTFETHDFTKSGDFTGNVSISGTGDFYGIIVVTVAALPFCTTPTMPSDETSTICEADSKPTWNATPDNAAAITGASQTISYSWKKEGSDTELATTATYTPTTNGTYKCTVTVSKASHISRTAVMTCTLVINSAPDKPTISGNAIGTVGHNVLLTANTTVAASSYQWYKGGVAIGGATLATYNANEASAGTYEYTVTATNSCGTSVASNAHTVTFSEAVDNVKPIISASQESACTGATITLTATTYHPTATLTWYKDGVTTGQTGTTYTISTAAAGDAGVYTLKSVLAETEDLISDGITISINTAPAAFSDFRTAYSVDVEATTVTLNASAPGATSYAWYSATTKNATTGGVLLAEVATTSYSASLAGVAEGKEYYFYCIAENACGNNSAAATTVTVTAVSLEECLDMTDASDAGAPELEGTYATLSGTTSGTSTVSSLTYIKLGSSSYYIQLEAETGYTFATVTVVLVANSSNQKMVYATSTNGSSWTYTEHTLSGDAKVRRTLVIDAPANTKYVQIWRQADGKGQGSTLYVDPEICYEMERECTTPPTFQFEKPASTKITADSYTMGSGAYTSPTLNKGSLAGAVTYSSSDESVATVNSSGVVTILDAGSTTIKAVYAGDATYCATQTYYVLTVSCQVSAPELTTTGSSVACSSSITITARNSSTHAAYTGEDAGGTYEWYRNGELMVGEDGASITVDVTGTYYVVYTKDDCSQRSTNVATVTSDVVEPSAQRLTPFQYYKYNHTYYQVGDPDIPGGTEPDIVGPMRHLFKVTSSRLVDSKPCQVKKEIIRANVSLGAPSVVTDSYIKYEDNKDGSYNVMLDLNAITTLNKREERLVIGDTLVLTATPFDACGDPATSETKSIKVYVIDESEHPLAFIVSGASGNGTKRKSKLVLNGDFLTGYNKADLCQQTGDTTWNSAVELPLYTGIKADSKFIVVPVNGYATFNKLNYEPFELLLLTDFVVTDGSKDKKACANIVNDMAALVDYRPILSLKAHMARAELTNWKDKGFTTLPEVPGSNPVNTMKVLCYAHPMFDGASGAVTDPSTGLTTITITSGGGYDSNKALQGFRSEGLTGFVFIASIDGGSKGTLYSCIERQNKIDARLVVLSVNGNAHSQINSYGQSAIIKTLEYLLETDPVKVSDCTVTFDNGASYADYNEDTYHAAGGTGSKGDGLWATAANWSTKKLPLADQNVKINADVTVTGDRSVLSIRFNDNYKMTIAPSGSLSVPGYISKVVDGEMVDINEANRITIQSNDVQTGVLIHSQKSGTLAATVQLVSKAYSVNEGGKKKKYWQYVGLPVQAAYAEDAFYGAYTYKYEETAGWKKKGTGSLLEEFWGIGLSIDNDVLGSGVKTFNIAGNLAYATDRDIELTKTADKGEGENMIGNSWTAPIHIPNMEADDFEGATATIYLYNTGRDEQAPGGAVGASTSANGSTQAGQWVSIPVFPTKLDPWLGPTVIPAMQAFEIDVAGGSSSGTLHLDYDKLVRDIETPDQEHHALLMPQRYQEETPSMMRLRVADSTTYTDLYLIEGEGLTDAFDNGWDGKYQPCDGRSATLYALSPIGSMAVLAQQSINNTAVVFAPGKQSEYTFTFGYDGEMIYYLNDIQLEKSTEIKEGNEYRFTYNEGDLSSRFVVSTTPYGSPSVITGIDNVGETEKVQKVIYNNHVYIIRGGRIFDVVGKVVK